MLTIRRKYKSFTVLHQKDRITAKRKEDTFTITTSNATVYLSLGVDERIGMTGSILGYAELLTPKDDTHRATMVFGITIEKRRYLLTYPQKDTPFVQDEKGTVFYFQQEGRCQRIQRVTIPLDTAILFAICLLIEDFLEWEYL